LAARIFAQDYSHRTPFPEKSKPMKKSGASDQKKDEGEKKKEAIKPYDQVITKGAKTRAGLFLVHKVDEKWFFEIPTNVLARNCSG
jgi:hypothetical protein